LAFGSVTTRPPPFEGLNDDEEYQADNAFAERAAPSEQPWHLDGQFPRRGTRVRQGNEERAGVEREEPTNAKRYRRNWAHELRPDRQGYRHEEKCQLQDQAAAQPPR
jgi:hypothetical protein